MTVKIGVLADTHMHRRAKELPEAVCQKFREVDLIIHAGDLVDLKVISELEQFAPVEAVAGNIDPITVRDRLPRKKLITVAGYNIGIIHGDGTSGTTVQRARKAFADEKPVCIVFGHSHKPFKEWMDGVLMFNPGSPTDRRGEPLPSFGLITLGESLQAELFYFDGKKLI